MWGGVHPQLSPCRASALKPRVLWCPTPMGALFLLMSEPFPRERGCFSYHHPRVHKPLRVALGCSQSSPASEPLRAVHSQPLLLVLWLKSLAPGAGKLGPHPAFWGLGWVCSLSGKGNVSTSQERQLPDLLEEVLGR